MMFNNYRQAISDLHAWDWTHDSRATTRFVLNIIEMTAEVQNTEEFGSLREAYSINLRADQLVQEGERIFTAHSPLESDAMIDERQSLFERSWSGIRDRIYVSHVTDRARKSESEWTKVLSRIL